MPLLQKRKGGTFYLNLPLSLVEGLEWEKGDIIKVVLQNDDIVLKKEGKKVA